MSNQEPTGKPDSSAIRTALWRALHVQSDPSPPILDDRIGLELADPEDGWEGRPDMDLHFTRRVRLSIAARARFVEDLMINQYIMGVEQYVILGAGLDTFAQRNSDLASKLKIFEIDKQETQIWKQNRLRDTGYGVPQWLRFVPVDFEKENWIEKLIESGFDRKKPSVISCTGVSLYLTHEGNLSTLRQVSELSPGSTLAYTYLIPKDLVEDEDRELLEISIRGAERSGTPFRSFFRPEEILDLAKQAGFQSAQTISKKDIVDSYFKERADGLDSASGEEILIASN